ncbi:hypothetical protein EDC01DRAFT_635303 [Geopyxis carbonaria]|nr:hypothetical protein EDC01DRAFT_635303 [Geopyxis carbonaria]
MAPVSHHDMTHVPDDVWEIMAQVDRMEKALQDEDHVVPDGLRDETQVQTDVPGDEVYAQPELLENEFYAQLELLAEEVQTEPEVLEDTNHAELEAMGHERHVQPVSCENVGVNDLQANDSAENQLHWTDFNPVRFPEDESVEQRSDANTVFENNQWNFDPQLSNTHPVFDNNHGNIDPKPSGADPVVEDNQWDFGIQQNPWQDEPPQIPADQSQPSGNWNFEAIQYSMGDDKLVGYGFQDEPRDDVFHVELPGNSTHNQQINQERVRAPTVKRQRRAPSLERYPNTAEDCKNDILQKVSLIPGTTLWKCDICGAGPYKRKNEAKRHITSKHLDKVKCPLADNVHNPCGKQNPQYRRSDHLQGHWLRMHPNEPRHLLRDALLLLNRGQRGEHAVLTWIESTYNPFHKKKRVQQDASSKQGKQQEAIAQHPMQNEYPAMAQNDGLIQYYPMPQSDEVHGIAQENDLDQFQQFSQNGQYQQMEQGDGQGSFQAMPQSDDVHGIARENDLDQFQQFSQNSRYHEMEQGDGQGAFQAMPQNDQYEAIAQHGGLNEYRESMSVYHQIAPNDDTNLHYLMTENQYTNPMPNAYGMNQPATWYQQNEDYFNQHSGISQQISSNQFEPQHDSLPNYAIPQNSGLAEGEMCYEGYDGIQVSPQSYEVTDTRTVSEAVDGNNEHYINEHAHMNQQVHVGQQVSIYDQVHDNNNLWL